jgi:hypothetical protein
MICQALGGGGCGGGGSVGGGGGGGLVAGDGRVLMSSGGGWEAVEDKAAMDSEVAAVTAMVAALKHQNPPKR